ncbi:cobalamin biosynthesis protein [Pseudomonas sp. CAU 1711]|uniref:cobalamin biosynthesis protein n=1 Tax=Pseudomonas sp. CAU 1711 TaxID=3140356 RepID=UPI0032617B6F
MLIAGLGCRRGCTASELRELLEQTLERLALPLSALHGLASSAHKHEEPGLLQLAAELNLSLEFYAAERLALYESRLSEGSESVRQLTGAASVAEASALACASERAGRPAILVCAKRRSAVATLAIARA